MEEADKDWMIRMVVGCMFLLLPAYLCSTGLRAVKRLSLCVLSSIPNDCLKRSLKDGVE